MNKQQTFFDSEIEHDNEVKKLHRRDDPIESRQAAEQVNLPKKQREFVELLKQCHQPATALEVRAKAIANHYSDSEADSIRKRAAECVRSGAVVKCKSRKCRITGNAAATFIVHRNASVYSPTRPIEKGDS